MRVLTWNCRRATRRSPVWEHLHEWSPDIALLQEVTSFPSSLINEYDIRFEKAAGKSGQPQRFGSALLVKGEVGDELQLRSNHAWADSEIARFSGNLFGNEVQLRSGRRLRAVCVYSPAWPVDRGRLAGVETSHVKLTLNPDVWVADLLWSALKAMDLPNGSEAIVGGDFNLSETFDAWRGGPRGNREYLDRMGDLGLMECLRAYNGALTPTFRNPCGGKVIHQIDHLFVTPTLASRLISCVTGDAEEVFGGSLSDHLPVVADFEVPTAV